MDRFIAIIAYVAVFVSVGFANPIQSEYGVPFDTYGVPSFELSHVPPHRSLDLPPIVLPPPVDRIFVSEKVPIPLELTPPIHKTIISERPIYPVNDVSSLPALQIPHHVELNKFVPAVRTPLVSPKIVLRGEEIVAPPNTQLHVRDDKNQYSVAYQNPDGTEVDEQGKLISTDNGWEYVIAKTGSYKYVSPEGIPVHVKWIADENGFRLL